MNKTIKLMLMSAIVALPTFADEPDVTEPVKAEEEQSSEFQSDERLEEGFITQYLNRGLANLMDKIKLNESDVKYGRTITDYVSAPKFGGYYIGRYSYSDMEGAKGGDGFTQKLIRMYVDGTILKDFKYRFQLQMNNSSFFVNDVYVEWAKFKEFSVKVGQYKRAFGFENPMNPWDVGTVDYSQMTSKLTGHNDYIGGDYAKSGGRDQGIQLQGDLFPIGKDKHRFLHYQLGIWNGQGINTQDIDGKKDFIGNLQFQPVKDLLIGMFGWKGTCMNSGVSVDRIRYAFGAKYEHEGWSARGEYAHNTGHCFADYDKSTGTWSGTGKADAWYATVGIPFNAWLKCYLKYDAYRSQANWATTKTIYTICPNIQLHKNLMFQLQYNYVYDKTSSDKCYNEILAEAYIRF